MSKYYSERGAMKEHSGATRLKSNEVQNNICRSQSIKYFSDRLLGARAALACEPELTAVGEVLFGD